MIVLDRRHPASFHHNSKVTDQQIKQITYAAILLLWVLLGLWQLLMRSFYQFLLSGPERVFWFLFFFGLPLLVVFGIHFKRRWAGWLTMIYGALLILLGLRLVYAVVRYAHLPDIGLIILAPMILIGGHLSEKGYALYKLWWAGSDTDTKTSFTLDQNAVSVTFPTPDDSVDGQAHKV